MSVKTKKLLVFMLTVVMMLGFLGTTVFADVNPENLITQMETTGGTTNTDTLTKLGGNVLQILQVAGIIIGTIILVVLGLKYMMGSLEEKAEYKKTMIPYLVGAVIIFAGPMLARGIFTLIGNLGK